MSSRPRTAFTGVPSGAVMLSGGIPKYARKYSEAESSSISGATHATLPDAPDGGTGLATPADDAVACRLLAAPRRVCFRLSAVGVSMRTSVLERDGVAWAAPRPRLALTADGPSTATTHPRP